MATSSHLACLQCSGGSHDHHLQLSLWFLTNKINEEASREDCKSVLQIVPAPAVFSPAWPQYLLHLQSTFICLPVASICVPISSSSSHSGQSALAWHPLPHILPVPWAQLLWHHTLSSHLSTHQPVCKLYGICNSLLASLLTLEADRKL